MGETNRRCQRCGHKCVASCTGKTDQLFGMSWPGGREQQGYVPPHELTGLREKGASKNYMNLSWCLVCGQIQGDWPTKYGHSHLEKYAEKRHWEVIVCTPPSIVSPAHKLLANQWYSMFFYAMTKDQVESYVEAQPPDQAAHWSVHEVCEETTIPDDADILQI